MCGMLYTLEGQQHTIDCPRHDPDTCPECSSDETGFMRQCAKVEKYAARFERIAGGSSGVPVILTRSHVDLAAFVEEHKRCGFLDSQVTSGGTEWRITVTCTGCGAVISRTDPPALG